MPVPQLRNAKKQRFLSSSTAVARNAKSVKIFTVAVEVSVQDPTLLGAHVRQVTRELSVIKVDVQESHVKTEARASVKTSVNVHLLILVLSVQEKDWEPERTQHQTHKQFLTPAIV